MVYGKCDPTKCADMRSSRLTRCQHYIGNRAIELADGQLELQIAYSAGFTALSFFIPIMVLLLAFIAAGTNQVSWYRIGGGGSLAGGAICGSKCAPKFIDFVVGWLVAGHMENTPETPFRATIVTDKDAR